MEFPVFQPPYLGNGMTIALDAVVHVVISHGIAIGVLLIVAIGEYLGFRRSSKDWEDFSRDLLKPAVIIITGVGAVTGVGIWFITSAVAPRGIGSLLRVFFWPWFIEWIAFTLEVIFILVYYFTWDGWRDQRKRQHLYLGFGYVFFALISALLITGILGFMLTPDGWPWDENFWSAFLNATFLPQFLLRIGGAFALGVLFSVAFLLFARREPPFRNEALRFFGKIFLITLGAAFICAWWYLRVVPSSFKIHAIYAILTSYFSQHPEVFWLVNAGGASILLLFALFAIRSHVNLATLLIIPVLGVSMGFVVEFERIREFIRGPYLMPGYMYVNQMLLKESLFLDQEGTLENTYWYPPPGSGNDAIAQGAYLFAQNCSACHTVSGINDIRDRVRGRTRDGIFVILGHTQDMVPFMPPFSGTDDERRIMADFLYQLGNRERPLRVTDRFTVFAEGDGNE